MPLYAVMSLASVKVGLDCDGVAESAEYFRDGTRLLMHYRGEQYHVVDATRAAVAKAGAGASDGLLRAKMDGRVVALQASLGDQVEAGQLIVTIEAMKMEHNHPAPISGKIIALNVAAGDQVSSMFVLAQIEPAVAGKDLPASSA